MCGTFTLLIISLTEWKGPRVVIGLVIFVRHGGTYVRVHHSRLRKANADSSEVAAENDTGNTDALAIDSDMDNPTNPGVGGSIALTTGQVISYLDRDTGVSHTAKVMEKKVKLERLEENIRTGSMYNTKDPLT